MVERHRPTIRFIPREQAIAESLPQRVKRQSRQLGSRLAPEQLLPLESSGQRPEQQPERGGINKPEKRPPRDEEAHPRPKLMLRGEEEEWDYMDDEEDEEPENHLSLPPPEEHYHLDMEIVPEYDETRGEWKLVNSLKRIITHVHDQQQQKEQNQPHQPHY